MSPPEDEPRRVRGLIAWIALALIALGAVLGLVFARGSSKTFGDRELASGLLAKSVCTKVPSGRMVALLRARGLRSTGRVRLIEIPIGFESGFPHDTPGAIEPTLAFWWTDPAVWRLLPERQPPFEPEASPGVTAIVRRRIESWSRTLGSGRTVVPLSQRTGFGSLFWAAGGPSTPPSIHVAFFDIDGSRVDRTTTPTCP